MNDEEFNHGMFMITYSHVAIDGQAIECYFPESNDYKSDPTGIMS